jgi:hypothetical protein
MRSNICVATAYDAAFREIGDYCGMTLRCYAARFGLDAVVETSFSLDRPPAWRKIRLAQELLDAGYEHVMWVDADALFCRFDVDVRSVVDGRSDFYLVEHDHPAYPSAMVPNTGVFIARNCAWTRKFLDDVWGMTEFIDHMWWENAAVMRLMGYHSLLGLRDNAFNQDVMRHMRFLPVEWNFCTAVGTCENPIIKHYAGQPQSVRLSEMPRDALRACFNALATSDAFARRERDGLERMRSEP